MLTLDIHRKRLTIKNRKRSETNIDILSDISSVSEKKTKEKGIIFTNMTDKLWKGKEFKRYAYWTIQIWDSSNRPQEEISKLANTIKVK